MNTHASHRVRHAGRVMCVTFTCVCRIILIFIFFKIQPTTASLRRFGDTPSTHGGLSISPGGLDLFPGMNICMPICILESSIYNMSGIHETRGSHDHIDCVVKLYHANKYSVRNKHILFFGFHVCIYIAIHPLRHT